MDTRDSVQDGASPGGFTSSIRQQATTLRRVQTARLQRTSPWPKPTSTRHLFYPSRTIETWCEDVSSITLPDTKVLCAGIAAPTYAEIFTLQDVALQDGDFEFRPGVYLGIVESRVDASDKWMYCGSATGYDSELQGRTAQHASDTHREKYKQRSFFYDVIDEPDKCRWVHFRKLCVTEWVEQYIAEGEIPELVVPTCEQVVWLRETCLVAEQVYSGWLLTFCEASRKEHGKWSEMTPWEMGSSDLKGATNTPPLKQLYRGLGNVKKALQGEELRAHNAKRKREGHATQDLVQYAKRRQKALGSGLRSARIPNNIWEPEDGTASAGVRCPRGLEICLRHQ